MGLSVSFYGFSVIHLPDQRHYVVQATVGTETSDMEYPDDSNCKTIQIRNGFQDVGGPWRIGDFRLRRQANETFDPDKATATPSAQLTFENINPMIKMAAAWGDKSASAHGTFGQFPANFITPNHTHTGAYHGVVIKGVMTNPFGDEKNPPQMGPGSYWYVPAGAPHTTACVSTTPCEFYFHAAGPFDFVPVK